MHALPTKIRWPDRAMPRTDRRPASQADFASRSRLIDRALISRPRPCPARLYRSYRFAVAAVRTGGIWDATIPKAGSPVDRSRISDQRLANLMRSAQDGDAAAFASLLREITPLLRRKVMRKEWVRCPQTAEDIVQEILLSVHTARATYDPERPFLPWLMAIARNRMADAARRNARQAAHEVTVERLPEVRSEADQHRALCDSDVQRQLHQAIHQLPPTQRRAVELLKLREMTMKEAEAASGVSIGALKVAVHRAIKSLSGLLDKEERR